MIKDIKKVLEQVQAENGSVFTDVVVTNVSFAPAAKEKSLDYWATLTLNRAIPGMIDVRTANAAGGYDVTYREGLVRTVMVPLGTIVTAFMDMLVEVDDAKTLVEYTDIDEDGDKERCKLPLKAVARNLSKYKAILVADAHKEAASDKENPYISKLHELLNGATLNVIARPVKAGKVKSLFSLNDTEHEAEHDSIWHDIYGVRPDDMFAYNVGRALTWCIKRNAKNAAKDTASATNALADLLAQYTGNSAAAAATE